MSDKESKYLHDTCLKCDDAMVEEYIGERPNDTDEIEMKAACHAAARNSAAKNYVQCSFDEKATKFGVDSCATTHICNDVSMFLPKSLVEANSVGAEGIGGLAKTSKRGTIKMLIEEEGGEKIPVLLENVLHVESSPKNLMSVSQWKRERDDDPLLLMRGKHFWFL